MHPETDPTLDTKSSTDTESSTDTKSSTEIKSSTVPENGSGTESSQDSSRRQGVDRTPPSSRAHLAVVDEPPLDDSDRVEAFLDGDLRPWDRKRFESRLRTEPSLAAELDRARTIRDGLRALETPSCPPSVEQAVLAAARADERRRPLWLAAALAAVLTLALGASLWLRVVPIDDGPTVASATAAAETFDQVPSDPVGDDAGANAASATAADPTTVPPSAAEVAQAEAEIKLALAYLGRLGRTAGLAVDGSLGRATPGDLPVGDAALRDAALGEAVLGEDGA